MPQQAYDIQVKKILCRREDFSIENLIKRRIFKIIKSATEIGSQLDH